jgi:hypothetical protein
LSRSIHATRRELEEARLNSYREAKVQEIETKRIEKALEQKRIVKQRILSARDSDQPPLGYASPVPIYILDEGPYVHHATSAPDISALEQLLPAGILEGLSEIVFSLGLKIQEDREDTNLYDPDPWTGRRGSEILPGVYGAYVLGLYDSDPCRITVHAFVTDPSIPPMLPVTAYLKLRSLSTFVHEVAHHFDYTQRMSRGRWIALGGSEKKVERFAEHCQHEWTQSCVVPYLEQTYSLEVGALLDWVQDKSGVRLTLGELISDPRSDVNWLIYIFTVERALQQLAEDVAAGKAPLECKLNFATELHFCERYERALEILDAVLREQPGNEDALSLRADIWNHQEKHAEAEQLAFELIERNPQNKRARLELVNAYEGLKKWDLIIAAATENSLMFTDEYDKLNAIFERCKALWRIGRREASEADYRTLLADPRHRRSAIWARRVTKYREKFPAVT